MNNLPITNIEKFIHILDSNTTIHSYWTINNDEDILNVDVVEGISIRVNYL